MGTKFVILCLDQVLALKITRIVKGNQVINSFEAKMKKDLNKDARCFGFAEVPHHKDKG